MAAIPEVTIQFRKEVEKKKFRAVRKKRTVRQKCHPLLSNAENVHGPITIPVLSSASMEESWG